MNFTFTQDQLDFQEAIATMLKSEVTADSIRARWSADGGVDDAFLKQAHDLGLNSMLVPEALGGLGLQAADFILLAEACGEVALPEPLVESVMTTTPLLVDILDQGLGNSDVQRVIDGVLAGESRVAVGREAARRCSSWRRRRCSCFAGCRASSPLPPRRLTRTVRASLTP